MFRGEIMGNDTCVNHDEFTSLDNHFTNELKEQQKSIKANSEDIVRLTTMYNEVLAKLPDTINSLKEAITDIRMSTSTINNKIDDIQEQISNHSKSIDRLKSKNENQDESIRKLDDKGKVDWIAAITANFWKLAVVVGIAYFIIKDAIHL